MNDSSVSVVIVTFESQDTIAAALDALKSSAGSIVSECIVVDNGSADATCRVVEQDYPWVTLIRSDENLGYGRAVNRAALAARGSLLLVMNADVVIHSDAVSELATVLRANPNAAAVGPAIHEADDEWQMAGLAATPLTLIRAAAGQLLSYPRARTVVSGSPLVQTNWICGAVFMVRADVFRDVGGFDPRYFLYFEETDLWRRLIRYGHEIWATGMAQARHAGGASVLLAGGDPKRKLLLKHYYESRYYYLVKHFGWTCAVMTELLTAAMEQVRKFARAVRRRDFHGIRLDRSLFRLPTDPGSSV